MQERREFLVQSSLAAAGAALLPGAPPHRLLVRASAAPGFRRRLAERELLRVSRIWPLWCEWTLPQTKCTAGLGLP